MTAIRTSFWCAAIAAVLVLLTAPATAATHYVDGADEEASDVGAGSEAAPWKTIAHAVDRVQTGDTVIIRPGQYDELVKVTASGTENKLITFRADPSRKARVKGFVLEGDYISIEGFEITNGTDGANGIFAGEAHQKTARTGCRMIDNFIHDLRGTGVFSGEKALVRGNLIRNVGRGMFVNGGTLVADNEVDTLVPRMVEKDGKTRPAKTQYAFFAGDDITFRGNTFHGTAEKHLLSGMGVDFFVTWDAWIIGPSHRILIENNRCSGATHGSEPEAKKLRQSSHITYRNNLFMNTVHVGVLPKEWTHVTVENNTFINCGAYPVWFQTARQTEGSVVRNNLIAYWNHTQPEKYGWHAAESGVANYPLHEDKSHPSFVCDYNMFWACKNRGYGEHDFTAEPQFVDPEGGDFRLKPGSPGVDAGMTIEGIGADLRGVKRPQGKGYDVGCYETESPQADSPRAGKEAE